MKKIIAVFLIFLIFNFNVSAKNDTYKSQYEQSGASSLNEALPDDARDFFTENEIDPQDYNWVNKLSSENVFKHILDFFKTGAKAPVKSGAAVLAIILITAAFTSLGNESERFVTALYAAVLAVGAIISSDVWSVVSAAVSAIKGCGTFMLSFIPVFASITVLSGATVTAVSMSTLLISAAEGVTAVASHGILPLMGGYLAMSISSSVSPLVAQSEIVPLFKKTAMWVLSLATTVFIGILGIQTVVNTSADSLAIKTTKFFLGTAVPVAGPALSEAVSTISASVALLKSSVGIYGVAALAVIMLPIVAELIIWRLVLTVCSIVSEVFSLPKITAILKAIDSMLAVLLGISLLICGMFIISLTVVVTAGGAK